MPIRTVPGTDVTYYLIAVDKHGDERPENGTRLSETATQALKDGGYTDVFMFSHGWKGDVPAAIEQYDAWIAAMLACEADREQARQVRSGFRPLLIGFHWPSLPWGDEDLGGSSSFGTLEGATLSGDPGNTADSFVEVWADRIADSPAAREALRTIWNAALEDIEPERMPPEVVRAYLTLDRESGLRSEGVAAAPDADREVFDPVSTYEDERMDFDADYGGIGLGGLLSPLRQLSFWQMKKRAKHVGETGGQKLLQAVRDAAGADVRIHFMGHSFGCIVVSSMLAGAGANAIHSLFLVQGALSLWSFCSSIPYLPERPGHFNSIVRDGVVRGSIVTTRSRFDTAVLKYYPKGAGIAGQIVYEAVVAQLPKYGGVGTFGIQGEGPVLEDLPMLPLDQEYDFQRGHVYNLDADNYIRNGEGFSGAHNDIAHPEVAHAFWAAALVGKSA